MFVEDEWDCSDQSMSFVPILRCSSCFDEIKYDAVRGYSGRACRNGSELFHAECYRKVTGTNTFVEQCEYSL